MIFSTYDAGGGSGSGGIDTITGNSGSAQSPSGGNFNIVTSNSTVKFEGSTATETLNFAPSGENVILGSAPTISGAVSNSGLGYLALYSLSSGDENVAVGRESLAILGAGSQNTSVGNNALHSISTGNNNVAVGYSAGSAYVTGSESSNICIGSTGTNAESNALRLGTQGASGGQQNKCYIAGITGVTTSLSKLVTINASTSQMGVATDINTSDNNLTIGTLMPARTTGTSNVSLGESSMNAITSGMRNVAIGTSAGVVNSTGTDNVCVGNNAMFLATSPERNTSIGTSSLFALLTGEDNIAIGYIAGAGLEDAESSNIMIGNLGVAAESNAIRIGTAGSGGGEQNKCYIAGINGVTVTGTAVLCAADGQLGTVVSSERFKEDIRPMHDESKSIYRLDPVLFKYKKDPAEQRGLIAEQVHEVMPDLVIYDEEDKPFSVKYHELPVLMLNEMKKLKDQIDKLYQILF